MYFHTYYQEGLRCFSTSRGFGSRIKYLLFVLKLEQQINILDHAWILLGGRAGGQSVTPLLEASN